VATQFHIPPSVAGFAVLFRNAFIAGFATFVVAIGVCFVVAYLKLPRRASGGIPMRRRQGGDYRE
jgi:hypothetical protein